MIEILAEWNERCTIHCFTETSACYMYEYPYVIVIGYLGFLEDLKFLLDGFEKGPLLFE